MHGRRLLCKEIVRLAGIGEGRSGYDRMISRIGATSKVRNVTIWHWTETNGVRVLRIGCTNGLTGYGPDDNINGNSFIAIYHGMSIGDESQNFLLKTGRFIEEISTAYDSFTSCNGAPFTTFDRDNDNDDSNCAETYKGGWWYKGGEAYCTYCSFNTDNEPKWIGLKSKVVLIRILVG
eukprot:gene7646-13466_t